MDKTEYRLIRSRRKTLALVVLPDGTVEVRSPSRTPQKAIDAFVSSRRAWLERHLAAVRERLAEQARYSAGAGESVLLHGESFPVRIAETNEARFDGAAFFLPPDRERRKEALTRFYRERAERELPPLTRRLAGKTGFSFSRVSIGSAETRWGSCSGKNAIRLSWRLVLLPEELIAYVVVHELCHTAHHDHSASFWREVERHLPDRKALRAGLRVFEKMHEKEFFFLR